MSIYGAEVHQNWSKWKKDTVFLVIFINTIVLASVPSPMLAPSIFELSKVLGVPLTDVAGLSGWQLLTVGLFGYALLLPFEYDSISKEV